MSQTARQTPAGRTGRTGPTTTARTARSGAGSAAAASGAGTKTAAARTGAAGRNGTAGTGTARSAATATGTVRTRPARAPEPEVAEEPAVRLGDALEWLWRFFISRRTGLVLILALGVMSLVGTLIDQAPAEVRADPQAYASWVDAVQSKYGGWTTVLDKAGAFGAFSSWWFKGTLVLLTTSLIACSAHRIPTLWRRATAPKTQPPNAFFDRAGLRAELVSGLSADRALAAAEKSLRGKGYRALRQGAGSSGQGSGRVVYADRFRWAPFGSIAAHLGLVVVLLGAFTSATTGFKDPQFAAPVGSRVEVGHGSGLQVQALAFNDSYYDNGSPKDYASDLAVYRNGRQVARQTVRVNQPLSVDGITFYQSFFGTAASMKVTDGAQKVLVDTAVPLLWGSDDGKHTIGQLTVPGQQLTVYVVMPSSGEVDPTIQAGQVQLEVYKTGASSPLATQVLSQGKPAAIAGLNFTFQRERQFTGLIVARDPGVWLVWGGSALMVVGIFAVFFFPHRRVWVLARPRAGGGTTLHVASHLKREAAFEPQFRSLVDDLERDATGPDGTRSAQGGSAVTVDADAVDTDPADAGPADTDPADADPVDTDGTVDDLDGSATGPGPVDHPDADAPDADARPAARAAETSRK